MFDALLELREIVAGIRSTAVERVVLAAVNGFLGRERLDFVGKLQRRAFAKAANALHEISLALRKGRGKRIVDGGGLDPAAMPQALCQRLAIELPIARRDRKVGWSRQGRRAHERNL